MLISFLSRIKNLSLQNCKNTVSSKYLKALKLHQTKLSDSNLSEIYNYLNSKQQVCLKISFLQVLKRKDVARLLLSVQKNPTLLNDIKEILIRYCHNSFRGIA